MHVIVIGAAPSGLYTALQLKKAGIAEVTIYDPRVGQYVRPGHILSSVLESAERGLGVEFNFRKNVLHIKDIERLLYEQALSQGIAIIPKKFTGFDRHQQGIIVVDSQDMDEFVPCDYVMDCTGSRRAVMNAVNEYSRADSKPFSSSLVSQDVVVEDHLLAYLKFEARSLKVITQVRSTPEDISGISSLEFVRGIERLRQFGWSEFVFPRCYNMPFGKDKACFYLEAPEYLPEEQKMNWFQAVVETRTGDDGLIFSELPESKTYKNKPRLTYYNVNPIEISPIAHQENGLPMVIVQGDAQIDPNYVLAHGIIGAFERIDVMMKHFVIRDGKIIGFQKQEFEQNVAKELQKHRMALTEHYKERKEYFISWLHKAKKYYTTALSVTRDTQEKHLIAERIEEIERRITYHDALKILKADFPKEADTITTPSLLEAKEKLIKALPNFSYASKENKDITAKLKQLLTVLEGRAKALYSQGNLEASLHLYREVLHLGMVPEFGVLPVKHWEASVCAKMIAIYRKTNRITEAFPMASKILSTSDLTPELKTKILFHVLKGAADALKTPEAVSNTSLVEGVKRIYNAHSDFIGQELQGSLKNELATLDSLAPSSATREFVNLKN